MASGQVARQNLIVYQGADFRRALEFRDGAAALMNLTGYVFRGQARTASTSDTVAFSFIFTLRDQGSSTGMVDMHIQDTATSALTLSKVTTYVYDVEMVDATGDVTRVMEGTIQVYPEVTK